MPILPALRFHRDSGAVRDLVHATSLGLPVLGSLPTFEPDAGTGLPNRRQTVASEAYRRLVDLIRVPDTNVRGRAIVVTSAESGGGHSAVAVNLATLLARAGGRVVLVDADLRFAMRRKPGDGSMSSGFASLLANQLRTASGTVVHTLEPRLKLLPVGSAACSPATLMHSARLALVFEELRRLADYVIFEAPPVLSWDGTIELARLADTTLLVLETGRTSRETARRAAAKLKAADLNGLGVVLDRAPASSALPGIEDGLAAAGVKSRGTAAPAAVVASLPEAEDEPGDERLAHAVRDLLADVEEALKLIQSIRQGREPGLSR